MSSAKVMENFTICIAQPIRESMQLKKGDRLILSMNKKGEFKVMKGISSFDDLVGIGEESFKSLGGGEAFIKSERKNWD